MFGTKKRHKLPRIPESVAPLFDQLCEELPVESVPELARELDSAVEKIVGLRKENRFLDEGLADEIAQRCRLLLDRYAELSSAQRKLAIGAIRYFVMPDDPMPEGVFASGLEDDAKVMNYVLQELGIEDAFIYPKR